MRREYYRSYRRENRQRSRKEAVKRDVLSNAVPDGECLIWQGARVGDYGYVNVLGTNQAVHRIAYEQKVGPIPAGYDIHHVCGRKPCCNPAHLKAVSRAQHIRLDGRLERYPELGRKGALARWHGQAGSRTR
jgi:hypothetical protein